MDITQMDGALLDIHVAAGEQIVDNMVVGDNVMATSFALRKWKRLA